MAHDRNALTSESLTELAAARRPPFLSLYQPTHRHSPGNRQDPIRFRNLVKELESSLRQKYPAAEAKRLLDPFEKLADDWDFWAHTLDGLAVLASPDLFRVFLLQRPVAELAVAAESFHAKPLRRFLQSADRYQILGLSLRGIRLFEGNRDLLSEIEAAPGIPRTFTEALGDEHAESHPKVASYGGIGQGTAPMHHGDGGKADGLRVETERFFRIVDRAVLEGHSRPSGLPLLLAALPEQHHLFRQLSHNPFLMAEGLALDPGPLSPEELRERAWLVVEPRYRARLAELAAEYAEAKAKGRGDDDVALIAKAAVDGRVATLMVESDRVMAGRLDEVTGRVETADLSHPQIGDLLDDLGELVAAKGGRVLVLPAERMPTSAGLAAMYRY